MFDIENRYETRGINQKLDIRYRLLIWQLIDELGESQELDYLQVFKFEERKDDNGCVSKFLVHTQEVPEYKMEHVLDLTDNFVEGTVFVIDDGDHSTMLWADEY